MNLDMDNKNKIGISLSVFGIIFVLIMTFTGLTCLNTWYDSSYSMWISSLPLNQLIEVGIGDVHPILYYLLFKVFINIFEVFGVTNTILIGKILSLIPIYLLILLGVTKVKKNFGWLAAGIFVFCMISMPLLPKFAVELRMYSWGLFFATAALIYVIDILKESNYKKWIVLTVLAICASYTHYFSALTVILLYLFLLIHLAYNNRDLIKYWLVSVVVAIIAYIPWIQAMFSQIHQGQNGYWVQPLTLHSIIDLRLFFSPVYGGEPKILSIIFLIAVIILFIYSLLKLRNKKKTRSGVMAILIFIGVILISWIFSLTVFPIYTERFVVPSLGCLWLGVSILLTCTYDKNKKIFGVVLAILLIIGCISFVYQVDSEYNKYNETLELNETLHSVVGYDNVLLYDNELAYIEFGSYLLNDNLNVDPNKSLQLVQNSNMTNLSSILNLNGEYKVYYISQDPNFYQECLNHNIQLNNIYSDPNLSIAGQTDIYEIIT